MTTNLIKALTIFCLITFIVSCGRPTCNNTNTIFDTYSPETKIYKDELVKQLSNIDKSKLSYWMEGYQEKNNSQYLHVRIQGDGLCAKTILTLNGKQEGLEEIIKNKGIGYRGAKLKDLKFRIRKDSTSTEFIFEEIYKVID